MPQNRCQTLAARLFGRQPDLPHHRFDDLIFPLRSRMNPPGGQRQTPAQQLDRVFAPIEVVLTQFIQHPTLAFATPARIANLQLRQPILFQFFAHVHSHRFPVSFFHESTTPFGLPSDLLPVSFNLSQLASRCPSFCPCTALNSA